MNIVKTHKEGNKLEVKLNNAFNLTARNKLENRLPKEITHLQIDLSDCRLVDSEGVIFMFEWQNTGNTLELINPPDILFEIIEILELREHWNATITETN
mgnify:CR=1 FL=1